MSICNHMKHDQSWSNRANQCGTSSRSTSKTLPFPSWSLTKRLRFWFVVKPAPFAASPMWYDDDSSEITSETRAKNKDFPSPELLPDVFLPSTPVHTENKKNSPPTRDCAEDGTCWNPKQLDILKLVNGEQCWKHLSWYGWIRTCGAIFWVAFGDPRYVSKRKRW